MADVDAKAIATRCLTSWTAGDFATTRWLLHDDVTFAGPIGEADGADAYVDGVRRLAQNIKGVVTHDVFGDAEDVCVIHDLVFETPPATIPTAGWYKVREGKVAAIRVFFDPRPLGRGR